MNFFKENPFDSRLMDIGTAIGIGSSLLGGVMSSKGSSKAADTINDAAQQQVALLNRQYDDSRNDLAPYRNVGTQGINRLGYLLGLGSSNSGGSGQTAEQLRAQLLPQYTTTTAAIGSPMESSHFEPSSSDYWAALARDHQNGNTGVQTGTSTVDENGLNAAIQSQLNSGTANADGQFGSLAKPFGMEDYQADPGYQFRLDEGMKALERSQAAKGGLLSGAAAKAATRFNQNEASNEYLNTYNRYNTDQNNLFSRLATVSGVGQGAANQTAALGQANANSSVGLLNSAANATASNQVQQGNNWSTGLNSLGNQLGGLFSNNGLSSGAMGLASGGGLFRF